MWKVKNVERLTAILFRDFMIRTIAASISCLRSSSTLLRVSFRSGSDSPLAATVWIFTLHESNNNNFELQILNVDCVYVWSLTYDTSKQSHRSHRIRLLAQCPLFLLIVAIAVEQSCPSTTIAMRESNLFPEYRSLAKFPRKSFADGCWTASIHTSGARNKVLLIISINQIICRVFHEEISQPKTLHEKSIIAMKSTVLVIPLF